VLPKLPKHGGDRNRTSPFAFTGNKFEFRALGSSMSLGLPNTVLNTIVAQAVDRMATAVAEATARGSSLEEAVLAVVKDTWSAHKRIVFDGDGYSEDWHDEAERRGLANLRQTPDALPWLVEPSTVEVFEHYDVLSERELEARYEVFVEQYTTTINIEGETAASIARTMLLPAAIQWAGALGRSGDGAGVTRLKAEIDGLVDAFVEAIFALEDANANHPQEADPLAGARYVQQSVIPAMAEVREVADRLEKIVPDDLWPLPKYAEILFIK
jgi:glutamine synthetase